jgi:ribonuclease T1
MLRFETIFRAPACNASIVRRATLVCVALTLALASALVPAQTHARTSCPLADTIKEKELPKQGRDTLALIREGGPFPHDRDGITFQNRERVLPKQSRGFYKEYTVRTPGVRHRGARRIVCGGDQRAANNCFYTSDHYKTFSCIAP